MKKCLISLIFIVIGIKMSAQVEKGDIIIRIDGDYTKAPSSQGVTSNLFINNSKTLNIGPSIGLAISDNFEAGVGLSYYWNKETTTNIISSIGSIKVEEMNITSKSLMPNIYLGYYYNLSNKFSINTNLVMAYGSIKNDLTTLINNQQNLESGDLTVTNGSVANAESAIYIESTNKANIFQAHLNPELSYYITPKFGLSVIMGGIQYSHNDTESAQSNFAINFHPNNWRFGLKFKL